MQCLGTGMHTKKPGSRNRRMAAVEKPQLQLLGWDPLPSSAKRLFSRAQQQVCPAGWPRAAVFGAELLLRYHSGYEAKRAELNLGVKTCHATPRSQEHKTVMVDSRAGAQGEPRAVTNTFPSKTSRQHFRCNAKSLAKQSSPGATCLERPSSTSQPSQVSTSHLPIFFFNVSSTLLAFKKHRWWGKKKNLYDMHTFLI